MSISTPRGEAIAPRPIRRKRRQPHSLKFDRAITAARHFSIALPSYHKRVVYKALQSAGIKWSAELQRWELVSK